MKVVISVVSHGHGELIQNLLDDIDRNIDFQSGRLIIAVRFNIPELISLRSCKNFECVFIHNLNPMGFGSNHNATFETFNPDYFFIVNPDVRILTKVSISKILVKIKSLTIASPAIYNSQGQLEDFFRSDLSLFNLVKRKLGIVSGIGSAWLCGIFLITNNDTFRKLGGFDVKYYMYVEDCDICTRLRKMGGDLVVIEDVSVQHDARRESRRKIRYFFWHLASLLRYWKKNFLLK